MSDDSAIGVLLCGAALFALFGGCDRLDGGSYQLTTSGDTVYRLNKSNGRVSLVTKDEIEPIHEKRSLHWWERLQLSDERVRWGAIKFNKDRYSCDLYTRWAGDRWHYWLFISPPILNPSKKAHITILMQDKYRMTLVSADVFLSKMDTGVDKDNKPTKLSSEGDMQATESDVKDAVTWHLTWDEF